MESIKEVDSRSFVLVTKEEDFHKVLTREHVLAVKQEISDLCIRNNVYFIALTGSVNNNTAREDSDVDFVYDYASSTLNRKLIYDLQEELIDLLGKEVHLISLRWQKPEVLLGISKNHEVLYEKGR